MKKRENKTSNKITKNPKINTKKLMCFGETKKSNFKMEKRKDNGKMRDRK